MSEKMKNIPKRRFPEFINNGKWEIKTLNEISKKIKQKNKDLEFDFVLTNSASDGIVSQRDYFDKDIANKNNLGGYYIVDVDDFVYNPRISINAPVGSLKRNKLLKGIMSPLYIVFRLKKGNLSFYEYYFESSHWYSYMRNIANMGAKFDRLNLDNKQFFELPLPFPHLEEQQKIVDCLNSIDSLIFVQNQKVQLLDEHKKALFQNLFPKDDEKIPKFRFSEFKNDKNWDEDILGNVATFRRGSFPQPYGSSKWYDDQNGMPFIQVFDVDENLKLKASTKRKISILGAKQSVFISEGTLIVTLQGSIGKVAITQYDAYIDRTLLLFEEFTKPIVKSFFAYLIQNLFEIEKKKAPGGIIKTITKEVLSTFKIKLPSQNEQKKIADILNSINEQVILEKQKLDFLIEHKKALLQQLFPSNGVING